MGSINENNRRLVFPETGMFFQTYRKPYKNDSGREKGGDQQSIRPHKHSTEHVRCFVRTVQLSQSEVEANKRQNEIRNMSNGHSDVVFYVCGSVHHSSILLQTTNEMQL